MPSACYRAGVASLEFLQSGSRGALLAIALAGASSALAEPLAEGDSALRQSPPAAERQAEARLDPWITHWWTAFDDALLTRLVESGIATDPDFAAPGKAAAQDRKGGKLFSGGKRTARVDAALRNAAIYELAQRKAEKAERIAQAYFNARATQRRIAVIGDSLDSQQENIKTASLRFRTGLAPAYDANFARTQSATTMAALGEAEGELQRDFARLAELTGIDVPALREAFGTEPGVFVMPPLPPEEQGDVLALRRADLLAKEQHLAADFARAGVVKADIGAAAAGHGANLSDDLGKAVAAYDKALASARADVAAARDAVTAAQRRAATLERAVESARVALGDTRMAYNGGLDRFVSVYVAESALLDVRQALIAAQRMQAEALIRYFTVLGGGWRIDGAQPAGNGNE